MEALTLWSLVGFLLASYAVIANDSVQTLGTWMASNNERFKWYTMWFAASSVLLCAVWYGWYVYGDISYGRLDRIPFQEVQWYHALNPSNSHCNRRPVSTSFLVLSAFASTFVLEKMLMKSVMGYAVAAIAAYAIWFGVSKLMDESKPVAPEHRKFWRVAQWTTTGFLWWTWLSHDMANIAVFLPRVLTVDLMVLITIFTAGLGFMFYQRGGKIQTIVIEKHSTKYIRSATIIDFCYWIILFIFKEINNIPMSTTWVFVGLLAGRELAIASFTDKRKMKMVFPMVTKDFMKMMVGLLTSVGVVVAVHSLQ